MYSKRFKRKLKTYAKAVAAHLATGARFTIPFTGVFTPVPSALTAIAVTYRVGPHGIELADAAKWEPLTKWEPIKDGEDCDSYISL